MKTGTLVLSAPLPFVQTQTLIKSRSSTPAVPPHPQIQPTMDHAIPQYLLWENMWV